MSKKVLIIGSGIAGISSSLKLKSYGINSIIVDKGDFIGGRISTRELKNNSSSRFFFHGAQFFTAKTHKFKKIICNKYDGPLKEPNKNFSFYISLLIDKTKRLLISDEIYKNK